MYAEKFTVPCHLPDELKNLTSILMDSLVAEGFGFVSALIEKALRTDKPLPAKLVEVRAILWELQLCHNILSNTTCKEADTLEIYIKQNAGMDADVYHTGQWAPI